MAYTLHEQRHDAAAGLVSFHVLESAGGRNTVVYVVVPVPRARRLSRLQLTRTARLAAKQALLDAAAAF